MILFFILYSVTSVENDVGEVEQASINTLEVPEHRMRRELVNVGMTPSSINWLESEQRAKRET